MYSFFFSIKHRHCKKNAREPFYVYNENVCLFYFKYYIHNIFKIIFSVAFSSVSIFGEQFFSFFYEIFEKFSNFFKPFYHNKLYW